MHGLADGGSGRRGHFAKKGSHARRDDGHRLVQPESLWRRGAQDRDGEARLFDITAGYSWEEGGKLLIARLLLDTLAWVESCLGC